MTSDSKNVPGRDFPEVWWVVLCRGIIAGALGLILFVQPAALFAVILLIMGAYWFAGGVLTLAAAIMAGETSPTRRREIVIGVVGILAGLVVFSQPIFSTVLTTTFLMYYLAGTALIYGYSRIMNGIGLRKEGNNGWSMILDGTLSVLVGIFLMGRPMLPMQLLAYSLGTVALMSGIFLVVSAFRLRGCCSERGTGAEV